MKEVKSCKKKHCKSPKSRETGQQGCEAEKNELASWVSGR